MDKNYFNNKLRELRKEKGLTQSQVANALEIKLNTYAHMEKDGKRPSVDMLKKLSRLFSVPIRELTAPPEDENYKFYGETRLFLSDINIFTNGIPQEEPQFMKDLHSSEQDIILAYRLLSDEEKAKVNNYVKRAFNNRKREQS